MTDQNPTHPDQMLEAALRNRLFNSPGLKDVRATVTNGVATFTGTVHDDMDIKRVGLIAQMVEGITEIHQKLQVVPASQGEREGYFDPVEGFSVPTTGTAAVDLNPRDEALNTTTVTDEDQLAALTKEGMDVFDSEGKKVGKVKEVRTTDFLLSRFLARNYYVPYIFCALSADGVHLNIKGDEMKDQGWASPHQETP